MRKFFCIALIALFASCERTPIACLNLNPTKSSYKVGEEILFSSECASNYFHIAYDFGDGDKFSIDATEGHIQKKVFKFKGTYACRVTYYSKKKKKTSFEERVVEIID
jgi:hypothetical protein